MDAKERELILQLIDDVGMLGHLTEVGSRPTPQACRGMLVPILRRWVVDGMFHQVQKVLRPHAVKFPIHPMKNVVEKCQEGAIEHWMGMIECDQIGMTFLLPKPEFVQPDGSNLLGLDERNQTPSLMPAGVFFEQKMFYWKARFFTRSQILALHANRLGGVHLDPRRAEDEGYIDELVQFFALEITGGNHQMIIGPEIKVAKTDPGRRGRTYDAYELIALDTATIFVKGINSAMSKIEALLH